MQTTYMPTLHGSAPSGQGDANDLAAQFAAAWLALLGDDAEDMRHDERLALAAQTQAEYLAHNDFQPDPHRGYLGSYANERIFYVGYDLPNFWPLQANNVESACRSWDTPAEAAAALTDHDTHRDHMRRLGWFRNHIVWGVGAAQATIDRGGCFYVCVTAPEEGN